MHMPKCDCGELLTVDTNLCMNSYPGIHSAKCDECVKTYSVYCGTKDDHASFFRTRKEVIEYDREK